MVKVLVKLGAYVVYAVSWVDVTSHSRKDLVVMKEVRLGRTSCRPEEDTGQKVSLMQKLGWGTLMASISISPGSHCSRRVNSWVNIS